MQLVDTKVETTVHVWGVIRALLLAVTILVAGLAAQSVGRKELPRADEKAVGSAAPSVVESVEMMAA